MSGRATPPFSYRETAEARRALDKLAGSHPAFQSIYDGLIWVIQRDPHRGTPVPDLTPTTYAIKSDDFLAIGLPLVRITYCLLIESTSILEIVDVATVAHDLIPGS
jgi:hypothetical protein